MDSTVWEMPPNFRDTWIWLLLNADHKTGQLCTSIGRICDGISYHHRGKIKTPNKRSILAVLQFLESNGNIRRKSNAFETVITIEKWSVYQSVDTKEVTAKAPPNVTAKAPVKAPQYKNNTENYSTEPNGSVSASPPRAPKSGNRNSDVQVVHEHFAKTVNKGSRLTDNAKRKIVTRLKTYSVDDLICAINRFASNAWWREHNANRGIAWFFHSDDRIDQFLNLADGKAQVADDSDLAPAYEEWRPKR